MGCCLGTFQVDPVSSRHDIDIDVQVKPHPPTKKTEPAPVQQPEPVHVQPEPEPEPVPVQPEPEPVQPEPEPEPEPVQPEPVLVQPDPEPVPVQELHKPTKKDKKKKKKSKSSSSSTSSDSGSEKGHKRHHEAVVQPPQEPEHVPLEPEITFNPEPEQEPEIAFNPDQHTYEPPTAPEISEVSLAGVSVDFDGGKDDFAFELAPTTSTAEIDDNFSLEVPSRPSTVPVYRYYNSSSKDHFYTANGSEIGVTQNGETGNHGFNCEGVAFYLAENETVGYVPVYRLHNGHSKDHFYTADEDEYNSSHGNGYNPEGEIGYISSTQLEGTVPVYRYFSSSSNDHFYTTNALEIGTTEPGSTGNHGFTCEGILGYAYLESQ